MPVKLVEVLTRDESEFRLLAQIKLRLTEFPDEKDGQPALVAGGEISG
jgi:hypothetical protein